MCGIEDVTTVVGTVFAIILCIVGALTCVGWIVEAFERAEEDEEDDQD